MLIIMAPSFCLQSLSATHVLRSDQDSWKVLDLTEVSIEMLIQEQRATANTYFVHVLPILFD